MVQERLVDRLSIYKLVRRVREYYAESLLDLFPLNRYFTAFSGLFIHSNFFRNNMPLILSLSP